MKSKAEVDVVLTNAKKEWSLAKKAALVIIWLRSNATCYGLQMGYRNVISY